MKVLGGLVLLAIAAGILWVLLAERHLDPNVYTVRSPSMEDVLPVGTEIKVQRTNPDSLRVGDIVSYRRDGEVITHRITHLHRARGQLSSIITRGDGNNVNDPPVPIRSVLGVVHQTALPSHWLIDGKVRAALIAITIALLVYAAVQLLLGTLRRRPAKAQA